MPEPTAPAAGSFFARRPDLLLAAAVLMAYLAWPSRQYSFDGVLWAMVVESSLEGPLHPLLFHAHHAAYGPLMFLLLKPLQLAGLQVDVLALMGMAGSFAGAWTAGLLCRVAQLFGVSPVAAVGAGALWGFSAGAWRFSTEPEVYVFSVLLWMLLLTAAAAPPSPARAWRVGLLFGGLLAFHLVNILGLPAVAWLLRRRGSGWIPGEAGRAALGAAVAAATPHAAGLLLLGKTGRTIAVLGTANPATPSWLGPFRPLAGLRGLGRFLVQDSGATATMLAAVLLLLAAAGVAFSWRREAALPAWTLALLGAPFLLFFCFWDTGNPEFGFFQVPFLLLGAACLASSQAAGMRRRPWVLAGAGVLLACHVTLNAAIPNSRIERNLPLAQARWIGDQLTARDLLILCGRGTERPHKIYAAYFARREMIILDFVFDGRRTPAAQTARTVRQRMERARASGGRVFIGPLLYEDAAELRRMEEDHGLPAGTFAAVLGAPPDRPAHREGPGGFHLYVLPGTAPAAAGERMP